MKARDLKFTRVKGKGPAAKCNACGCPISDGPLVAEITIGDGDAFLVVVCSWNCRDMFINSPVADEYILNGVAKALKAKGATNG